MGTSVAVGMRIGIFESEIFERVDGREKIQERMKEGRAIILACGLVGQEIRRSEVEGRVISLQLARRKNGRVSKL